MGVKNNIHAVAQLLAKCCPLDQICLLPVFVNKVLLEHSHIHSFTYRLWLFSLLEQQS